MYVCICNNVTDRDIKKAYKQGCDSYESICNELKVASCCGRCRSHTHDVIAEVRNELEPESVPISFMFSAAV